MSVVKQLLILCCLAGLAYGGYEGYRTYLLPPEEAEAEDPPRPVTIEVAEAKTSRISETVEAVGTTRALRSIEIVPEDEGRVVTLNITPGAKVKQGDVLVKLDETIERADLAEASARMTEQELALARIKRLLSTSAVSQASLEEATARLAEAEAALERARQRLANRTIDAPFDGIVGLSEIDAGARIEAGDMIARLDDLSQVELEFSLPETLFGRVNTGLAITATSPAFPDKRFEGRIEAVDSRIDPIARAFRTRAVIPNPEGLLPAGMFMSLTLILSELEALTVPEEAIVFQAAATYVFLIEGEEARRVSVTTGPRRDGRIAVLSGLEEGDIVAIRGLARLRDGSTVVIKAEGNEGTAAQDGDS
ncbi:efflux RND transporter periplasmic adaptor subunit [Roseovarius phycicola]|uniref:Efflux RND transporter periplasmic adaptor subunit n=1 Tax=Roseovarius phycicola TaxID=3080976 RepID=A0ABZ2HEV3_9RHOB